MKRKFYYILFVLSIISWTSWGQKTITVEDAIAIALKNNYNILLARNDAEIDRINNTPGNAGMLPNIAANGSAGYSNNSIRIKQSNDSIINRSNASSQSLNANVGLNWTVFDGGKMFVTKSKLNEIQALGEISFKAQVLQTTYDVIVAYFNIVKQKQQLSSISQVISFNKERVNILQTSFNSGASPKNNLLQAKIDLNVSTENSLTQQNIIFTAKRNLNQLLSRSIDSIAYDVMDSIPLNYKPDKAKLLQDIAATNTNILSFQKQLEISKLSIKETQSSRLPQVGLNAGYYYSNSNSNYGTSKENRTYGPQLGGTISIPLFQGGNINRRVAVSKIQMKSAEYDLENVKLQMLTQLQNAVADYENQQNLLIIEQENSALVKENLEISLQRLRYGQTTALEVRQAQQSFEDSFTRLITFKYNLKVAETKLKQLMANL